MTRTPLTILNAKEQLSLKDREYCQNVFDRYWKLVQIQFDANMYSILKTEELKKVDNTVFIPGMMAMEKWSKQFHCSTRELTKVFIETIEDYFRTMYHLKFRPFMDTNPEAASFNQLTDYKAIIYNILQQDDQKYFAQHFN